MRFDPARSKRIRKFFQINRRKTENTFPASGLSGAVVFELSITNKTSEKFDERGDLNLEENL